MMSWSKKRQNRRQKEMKRFKMYIHEKKERERKMTDIS